MNRRNFLTATALGAGAFSSLQGATKLPIRKGILLGMLPQGLSIADKFKVARDSGFESIEIGTTENPATVAEIRKASNETKLPVHSIMNSDHWKYPLSSAKPDVVAACVKGMETSLQNAAELGAQTVLLVPAVVNAETSYGDAYKRSHEQIMKMIPLAEKRKVVIAVENVWNKFLLSPLEFNAYVDSFRSPWVRAYFDVGNILLYGYPQDWIRTLGPRIAKIHFKDFTFRRNPEIKKTVADWVNLRDGDVPWKEIHAALKEIGYKGDATVELPGGDAAYLADMSKRVDLILEGA
jgi:hexulose-6-phosphate isomerase